jgi:cytoskeletal protein RodZ
MFLSCFCILALFILTEYLGFLILSLILNRNYESKSTLFQRSFQRIGFYFVLSVIVLHLVSFKNHATEGFKRSGFLKAVTSPKKTIQPQSKTATTTTATNDQTAAAATNDQTAAAAATNDQTAATATNDQTAAATANDPNSTQTTNTGNAAILKIIEKNMKLLTSTFINQNRLLLLNTNKMFETQGNKYLIPMKKKLEQVGESTNQL